MNATQPKLLTFPWHDYGYANGWPVAEWPPRRVKACLKLKHKREGREVGRCVWSTTCRQCRYTYRVDSSD